jgi:endonuclease YncB( thermonuclease family)
VAVLAGLWVAQAALGETLSGPLPARVVEVVDGDTLGVRVRIWLDQEVTTRVRLTGVDAPELRGLCEHERTLARRATAFVTAKVMAEAAGNNVVRLTDVRYGKYARRVVARVETADGEDLGQALLDAGLAWPYDGGRRLSWCNG